MVNHQGPFYLNGLTNISVRISNPIPLFYVDKFNHVLNTIQVKLLTHIPLDKMAAFSQKIFSYAFS